MPAQRNTRTRGQDKTIPGGRYVAAVGKWYCTAAGPCECDGCKVRNVGRCDHSTVNQSDMRDHIAKRHGDGTGYVCRFNCGAGGFNTSNMRRHEKVCPNNPVVDALTCPECGASQARGDNLKRHLIRVHKKTPDEAANAVGHARAERRRRNSGADTSSTGTASGTSGTPGTGPGTQAQAPTGGLTVTMSQLEQSHTQEQEQEQGLAQEQQFHDAGALFDIFLDGNVDFDFDFNAMMQTPFTGTFEGLDNPDASMVAAPAQVLFNSTTVPAMPAPGPDAVGNACMSGAFLPGHGDKCLPVTGADWEFDFASMANNNPVGNQWQGLSAQEAQEATSWEMTFNSVDADPECDGFRMEDYLQAEWQ